MGSLAENRARDRYGLITPILAAGEVYKFTKMNPPEGAIRDVLDVGTGNGHFVSECLRKGLNAYGVDIRNVFVGNQSRFVQADARQLPFPNQRFDLVHTHLFFDDLKGLQGNPDSEVQLALSEIRRVLRPNGILYMGFDEFPDEVLIGAGLELAEDHFIDRYYKRTV